MATPWIQDKVVFITGGASGIGAAVAALLHGRGARLALADVDQAGVEHTAHTMSTNGPKVLALTGDVTRLADMQRAVEHTVQTHGRIDMVWANAGVASFGPMASTDPAAWVRNIEVNLVGVFNTVHAALPHVLHQRGHVAVTASAASFVSAPCMSAYCATKSGVEAMCNSLRIEVAHHGVTVGAIHPSWVATPLVDKAAQLTAFQRLRNALPAPLRRDMPLGAAADIVARGLCDRHDRVYAPAYVRLMRWLRTPLHTRLGKRDFRRAMPEIERALANDVATHGDVVRTSLSILHKRFASDDKTKGRRKDGPMSVAKLELGHGDESGLRESRLLRQRDVSDLIARPRGVMIGVRGAGEAWVFAGRRAPPRPPPSIAAERRPA